MPKFMEEAIEELKGMSDEDFIRWLNMHYPWTVIHEGLCTEFAQPLGPEFEKVLFDNLWELYEND